MPIDSSSKSVEGTRKLSHYYVAIGSPAVKLITLVELLRAFEEDSHFGVAVCCRSRDSLDPLLHGLMQAGFQPPHVACLHSDMGERERREVLHDFKAVLSGGAVMSTQPGADPPEHAMSVSPTTEFLLDTGIIQQQQDDQRGQCGGFGSSRTGPCILALTDVTLKATQRELQGLGLRLLVNYDLPPRKDVYQRRIATLFGGKGRRGGRGGSSSSFGAPSPGTGSSSSNVLHQQASTSVGAATPSPHGGGFMADYCAGAAPSGAGGGGGGRAVVHMVVAGDVRVFREVESYESSRIVEVPVRVSDMLAAAG